MSENIFLKLLDVNQPPPIAEIRAPGLDDPKAEEAAQPTPVNPVKDPGVEAQQNPFLQLLDNTDEEKSEVDASDEFGGIFAAAPSSAGIFKAQDERIQKARANGERINPEFKKPPSFFNGLLNDFHTSSVRFWDNLERGQKSAVAKFDNDVANAFMVMDRGAKIVESATGFESGGAFAEAEKFYRARSEEKSEVDDPLFSADRSLQDEITERIGQLPLSLAEMMAAETVFGIAGLPILGAVENADRGVYEAAKGALKGAALRASLGATAKLPKAKAAAVNVGVFGGAAQLEGAEPIDIGFAAAVGGMLTFLNPKGEMLKENGEPAKVGELVISKSNAPGLKADAAGKEIITSDTRLGEYLRTMDKLAKDIGIDLAPSENTGPTPSILHPMEKLYMDAVRSFYPIEKLSKVANDRDLHNVAISQLGAAGVANHFLEFGGFDFNTLAPTGTRGLSNPLRKGILGTGIKRQTGILDDIPRSEWGAHEQYWVAKTAHEDMHPRGIESGIPPEQAKALVELREQDPVFVKSREEVNALLKDVFRYARDSEIISDTFYDNATRVNKFYVPRMREGGRSTGKGKDGGIIFHELKGSERRIVSPIRSIVQQIVRITRAAERNKLLLALDRQVGKPGTENYIVRGKEIPEVAEGKAVKEPLQIENIERFKASERVEETTPSDVVELFRGKDFFEEIPDIGVKPITPTEARPKNVPEYFERIVGRKKGKPFELFVDPLIADAINAFNLRPNAGLLDSVVAKVLTLPTKMLRTGVVEQPGFFLIKNPARDAVEIIFQSKNNSIPIKTQIEGFMSYVGRGEAYRHFIKSGGAQAALVAGDRASHNRIFQEMLDPRTLPWWKQVENFVMTPLDVVQRMAASIENAARVGESAQGIRKFGGAENISAAQNREVNTAARNVVIDYGVRGKSDIIRYFNAFNAFANAQVQGTDRFIREHIERPIRSATLGAMTLTIPTLALQAYQMQDPDYRERWLKLPNWRKVMFWNLNPKFFGLGVEHLIPVPIPFTWGLVYKAYPEAEMYNQQYNDPSMLKAVSKAIANDIQPYFHVNENGFPDTFVPKLGTLFQTLTDIGTNRSSFFGSDIENQFELQLPAKFRYGPGTTKTARILSNWLDDAGLELGPKKIDFGVRGILGRLGTTALRTSDEIILDLGEGFGSIPSLRPLSNPALLELIFGGLSHRSVEQGSSQAVTDFYNLMEENGKQANAFDFLLNTGDVKGLQELMKKRGQKVLSGKQIKALNSKIRSIHTARKKMLNPNMKINKRDRQRAVRQLNVMLDTLASQFTSKQGLQNPQE